MHLDVWALTAFACITSRRKCQKLADAGRLLVNGHERRERGRYVKAGDVVTLLAQAKGAGAGAGAGRAEQGH